MATKPAGWYRRLKDRRQHGYWDGDEWVDPQDATPLVDVIDEPVSQELVVPPEPS